MKAIRVRQFGGPEELRIENVPDPIPGPGQVLVAIRAIGVNPVDTYIRAGKYTLRPNLPYTPGQDAAGEIVAIGDGGANVSVRDRVYIWGSVTGAYAEMAVCDAYQAHPLPAHVTYDEGAGVGVPAGAAWRALFIRGAAQAGETVLIHGASGSVGMCAVQLACAAGLTVIATAGSETGRANAMKQGAHHAVAHGDTDAIRALTLGGSGVPLIIEMLASENLAVDLTILAPHGRVVIVGSRGQVTIDPRVTMLPELDIRGMSIAGITKQENIAMGLALVAALEARVLRPIVGPIFDLADAPKAHEAALGGETRGKILLRP